MSPRDDEPARAAALRRCLDPGTVCGWLNRCIVWPGDIHVERVRIGRFHPGKGGAFDFEYEVHLGPAASTSGSPVKLFGRLPRIEHVCEQQRRTARLSEQGLFDVLCDVDDVGMTVHSTDQDPKLAQMAECLDAERVLRRLGGPGTAWIDRSVAWRGTLMAYRAGRRFVVRYAPSASSRCGLVGKGFVDDRGSTLSRRQLRLAVHLRAATGDRVRVPRLVQYVPELKLTLAEWADTSLTGGPRSSAESWARCAGLALSAIHSADTSDLKRTDPGQPLDTVRRWLSLITAVRPDLAERAVGMVDMLQCSFDRVPPSQPVAIHGDFYESQLIVGRRTVTVLDLDMLSVGDRCIDVGNYLAHQWLWCLRSGHGLDRYGTIVRAMLESYETSGQPVEESALAFQWGVSLFRVGAIHAFRCATSPHAAAVWDLVGPVLRKGRRALEASDLRAPRVTDCDAAGGTCGRPRAAGARGS